MTATIDAGIVGLTVGPVACTVDARWLMAYAAGLGETDARYYDTVARGGPMAHPLFAVCYEWPVALALRAKAIDPALASLSVHVSHELLVHRPVRAGDSLRISARVTAVRQRRSGTLVVARYTTMDRSGVLVSTTDYGSLYRGVELRGPEVSADAERAEAETAVRWESAVSLPAYAAHVYTECARIFNPIHSDVGVARAAGLPGVILHGTATLALAVSRVVVNDLAGDPGRVRGVSARFTDMVELPSTVMVRGRGAADGRLAFDVVAPDRARVMARGAVTS
ncbi:MAG TPA: MaoC/PaaZ C-terminal domain-containing protein [Methylomirabilota bacterium]|jgi:acyl dehydratase|nr:MaoC/PaaZ C-terminal domain-containing protein [Methylomirabilota bacterium]